MKRSKHDLFVFPLKKTLIRRRHCSIGQSCCTVTSQRSISLFLESSSGMKFGSVRYINQSNRSISVRLFFLFFSRVSISRSYENRSIGIPKPFHLWHTLILLVPRVTCPSLLQRTNGRERWERQNLASIKIIRSTRFWVYIIWFWFRRNKLFSKECVITTYPACKYLFPNVK